METSAVAQLTVARIAVPTPVAASVGAVGKLPGREPRAPVAEVQQAARDVEAFAQSSGRNLEFRVDEASGRVIVNVRDAVSGELIRQIPDQAVLRFAQQLASGALPPDGLILDEVS